MMQPLLLAVGGLCALGFLAFASYCILLWQAPRIKR